jgi:hypothetical protein
VPSIQETIPDHLADVAEAARASFSANPGSEFKLTGIDGFQSVPRGAEPV